jgi:hypothetical protein
MPAAGSVPQYAAAEPSWAQGRGGYHQVQVGSLGMLHHPAMMGAHHEAPFYHHAGHPLDFGRGGFHPGLERPITGDRVHLLELLRSQQQHQMNASRQEDPNRHGPEESV